MTALQEARYLKMWIENKQYKGFLGDSAMWEVHQRARNIIYLLNKESKRRRNRNAKSV